MIKLLVFVYSPITHVTVFTFLLIYLFIYLSIYLSIYLLFICLLQHYLQPKQLLIKEVEQRKLSANSFITTDHGEIRIFGAKE
jgi:hypothetical protein